MSSPPNPGLMMRYAAAHVNTKALETDPTLAAFTVGMLKRLYDIDIGVMSLMTIAVEYNKQCPDTNQAPAADAPTTIKSSLDAVKVLRQVYEFLKAVPDDDYELFLKIMKDRDSAFGKHIKPISWDFVNPVKWGFDKFRENLKNKGHKFEGVLPTGEEIKKTEAEAPKLSAGATF